MRDKKNELFGNNIFLVAEIGLNHNGDIDTAREMIRQASISGADAVKFQTYVPEQMYSVYTKSLLEKGNAEIQDRGIIDFFAKFCFSFSQYETLKNEANEFGVILFSAPFDAESVDLLERLDVSMYKIASSEITNERLIERISLTGKPALISTGMSHESEIQRAVDIINEHNKVVLLHCVSLYPLEKEKAKLSRMLTMKKYGFPVGFSDHSSTIELAIYAAYMGASVIEKHFTLTKDFVCPDSNVSITPSQMMELRKALDESIDIRGNGSISPDKEEEIIVRSARRSMFSSRDIKNGEIIKGDDIIEKRPGTGVPANKWKNFVGKKANRDIRNDYPLKEAYFE
jgi:N,N'-diacetyllegionaminate synthase